MPNNIQVSYRAHVVMPAGIMVRANGLLAKYPALVLVDHDEGEDQNTELFVLEVDDIDSTRQLVLWTQEITALEPA